MIKKAREKYLEILRRTTSFMGKENLLSVEEIGLANSKVSLDTILESMGSFSRGLEATNYLCHFGEYTRLRDFVEVGLPEYTLQRLIALSYLQKRAENVIIPAQEELLILAINSLNSKYGKARVTKLKKRLGIKELNYH